MDGKDRRRRTQGNNERLIWMNLHKCIQCMSNIETRDPCETVDCQHLYGNENIIEKPY